MPTPVTHAAAGVFIASLCPAGLRGRAVLFYVAVVAAAAVVPDLDIIPYKLFGVQTSTMFGHRGFTHSLFFAAPAAYAFMLLVRAKMSEGCGEQWRRGVLFIVFFAVIMSHPVLDAFTDGGRGVAFFAPFTEARFRFPWHPIEASPIRLSYFLSGKGNSVLFSELKYVWLPIVAATGVRYTYVSLRCLLERRSVERG
ncbi:MAG: metal-dependent hydrolase [Deltaproteobacteria bacterium]|nr:metal-dependent hydrolase [Deltaproteobacteria bacterium]